MSFTPNLEDRERDKFVESPTRPNHTAIEVFVGNASDIGGGGSGSLTTQTISFSILIGQINTFVLVPTTGLLNIFNVEIYDATNTVRVFTDWRVSSSNVLEIKSASAQTFTIRIIGSQ